MLHTHLIKNALLISKQSVSLVAVTRTPFVLLT